MPDMSIQKNGYLQFDATTIDQYIKDRLNANPNTEFTDHNFEGSYFSSLIEVVAYTFNVLMFYLNQTSSESKFTDAQLYENMNRMVKMLAYNPIGFQSSMVPFSAIDSGLSDGLYVIPRYSYLNAGGTTYSFAEDFIFQAGYSTDAADGKLLYQGKFYEYPIYSAYGIKNEIVFLTPGDNVIIDHFNINVYVKNGSGMWEEWTRTDSLTLKGATDKCFEIRFNENQRYELKFGNGINGKMLNSADSVAIYYLKSDGAGKEISSGDITESLKYVQFASSQFTNILADLWQNNAKTIPLPSSISFSNSVPATNFAEPESVEDIRNRAPDSIRRKVTLGKTSDYDRAVKSEFSTLVVDVSTINNSEFIKTYLKYFKDLGVNTTNELSRFLFNQVTFADSCNFNNIYIFIKPKVFASGSVDYNKFLPPTLKQLVLRHLSGIKNPTVEPIIMDPVYMAIGIGINNPEDAVSSTDIINSKLVVIKSKTALSSDGAIKQAVGRVITEYFSESNTPFGMTINFPTIANNILAVDGVVDFRIQRRDSAYYYEGLGLIEYNPVYPQDVQLLLRTTTLKDFQVPYLINSADLINNIQVEVEV
jgi:hypothetical protein